MKKLFYWYYGTASIKKKLVISYVALVLLPILVLGTYSYHTSKTNLMNQTKRTMESNLSSITYSLQNNIQRENDNIKYLSYNAKFREQLEIGSADVSALAQEMNELVEPAFWYFITSDINIKDLKIYSPYVNRPIGSFLVPLKDSEVQTWYETHDTQFKTHWQYEDGRVYAMRMVLDAKRSSSPIGVMKLETFPEKIIEPIYQSEFLNNGIILTDGDGEVIGSRKIQNETLQNEIQTVIADGKVSDYRETDRYMLSVSEELNNGWKVYYYVDKAEISGQINRILATTGLVTGVCFVIAMALIHFISKLLSTRIMELKSFAEKVSAGDFEVKLKHNYTDEIGVVAESFEKMCQKIIRMMEEMYRLGMEKRAEELKALQAMMNPHFLYNSLSSIKWKAIRSGQDEIASITGLLAKFYRTALNNGKQITIVENEIENIKAYIEIQLRSHEYSFDVEYRISENDLKYSMPNFLLQPIVENAICHGTEVCPEGVRGKIRIEYERFGGFLLFRIINNGSDLKVDDIERILSTPGKGYGIYNIRERIRMYYDSECGIYGEKTEEGMTCFMIRIREEMKKQ